MAACRDRLAWRGELAAGVHRVVNLGLAFLLELAALAALLLVGPVTASAQPPESSCSASSGTVTSSRSSSQPYGSTTLAAAFVRPRG